MNALCVCSDAIPVHNRVAYDDGVEREKKQRKYVRSEKKTFNCFICALHQFCEERTYSTLLLENVSKSTVIALNEIEVHTQPNTHSLARTIILKT